MKWINSKRRISFRARGFILSGFAALLAMGIPGFYYYQFSALLDERLSGKLLRCESRIFACPKRVCVEAHTPGQLSKYLQTAGYSVLNNAGAVGQIKISENSIEVSSSDSSYFARKNALKFKFSRQRIVQIQSLNFGTNLIWGVLPCRIDE